MMLAYVASIFIAVLDSGVGLSSICAAKERENFEGGRWREKTTNVSIFSLPSFRSLFPSHLLNNRKINKNRGIAQSESGACRSDSLP